MSTTVAAPVTVTAVGDVLANRRQWEIVCTDVLAGLAQLPDASVHCVVTSVPYFGLRSYGTEPQVWGGDALCTHSWGTEGRSAQRLRNGIGSDTAQTAMPETLHPSTGTVCGICGAWRGELGQNTALDCLGWATGSQRGVCPTCGAPWTRTIERAAAIPARTGAWKQTGRERETLRHDIGRKGGFYDAAAETTGWIPGCDHNEEPIGALVCDIFSGAATTGLVALRLGRRYIGLELSPAYCEMGRKRLMDDAPMLNGVYVPPDAAERQATLWPDSKTKEGERE